MKFSRLKVIKLKIQYYFLRKFQFHSYSTTITFNTCDTAWVIDFLINLKDKVKVMEPQFLVKDIKNTIKKMNILYES
jgi:predicted DNA-binding transcriptional regulator YafY